jgi:hypothetical protein
MMNIQRLHESGLKHLTGCDYSVLRALYARVFDARTRRGRPLRHGAWTALVVALMKLRHDLPYRLLEAVTGIDAVTAHRMVRRVIAELGELPVTRLSSEGGFVCVDSTTVRVGTADVRHYTGYKHLRGRKVQVLCDESLGILDVSGSAPASVHDKTLWNRHLERIKPWLDRLCLADKAYAGARGEGEQLV